VQSSRPELIAENIAAVICSAVKAIAILFVLGLIPLIIVGTFMAGLLHAGRASRRRGRIW
jgi:hypothetical protein